MTSDETTIRTNTAWLRSVRISAAGLRVTHRGRYAVLVPWLAVDRIWVTRTRFSRALMIRLTDPAMVAGGRPRVLAHLRRRRAGHGAELIVPLVGPATASSEIAEAVARHSRGSHRLEQTRGPIAPDGELVVRTRLDWILPALAAVAVVLLLADLLIGLVTGDFPVLSMLLASVLLAGAVGGRVAVDLLTAPPVISPAGLLIRAAGLGRHDTAVDWREVEWVRIVRHGGAPALLVRLHDPDSAAGADVRVWRAMETNRRHHRADLVVDLLWASVRPTEVGAAVAASSGGLHRPLDLATPFGP